MTHPLLERLDAWFPKGKIGKNDQLLGAGLAAVYVIWLLATARELGFPRDEGFYFHAAGDYSRWFELLLREPHTAMQQGQIDAVWQENHEHPSLMKGLFAISWLELYSKHKVFADASTAFRFPAMVLSSVSLWITYLFGARAYSRRAGLVGALSLALMPHVFFHSHLACFDAPIMTMWLASIYVYWRSRQEGGLGWALLAGVVYGLTLETKHNAWILPAVFVPHALFAGWRATSRSLQKGVLPVPASLISMAIVGPLVFLTLWPWLWNDTIPRVQEYVNFHVNHVYYNIEYLHKNYFGPPSPRSYAPVMIAATVPAVTLLLFAVGLLDRVRLALARLLEYARSFKAGSKRLSMRDKDETDLLLFLGLSAPIAVFVLVSKTPIFGGTKHWMTAYPILAIFAGRGFQMISDALLRALPRSVDDLRQRGAVVGLGASVLVAPLAVTVHSHPFGLSAYTPFVGGTAGGADLGLNRQFWGFTTESCAPWLAANAPPNSRVFVHDTAWDSWARMADERRIRPDLRPSGSPSDSDFGLVHIEPHMNEVDYQEWVAFETDEPAYVLTHDGVPIVSIYRRRPPTR